MKAKNKSPRAHSGSGSIRIIGGTWRGRKIAVPSLVGLRPTPDRVRETLFNWLAPFMSGATCLDMFGGSGALSIEALSRGAAHVTLLENSADAIISINKMSAVLEIKNLTVIRTDSLAWLHNTPVSVFDIVFIDPPFHQQLVTPCCHLLETRGWLTPDTLIYIEYERDGSIEVPPNWRCHRIQQAGDVAYALYKRTR